MDLEKQHHVIILAEKIFVLLAGDPECTTPDIEFCFATASDFVNRAEKFLADNKKLNKIREELK